MKFTLKDYQDDAVKEVLDRLKKARKRWHEDADKHAFSLTATTGAGKTVMAAAVFEALFFGNDDYDFEADPGAVVLWFSDDPSLNEQSRWRLQEAADKLTISNLVTIGNSFASERFEAGKVYFLNTQKFSKNSLLVRGHDVDDSALETAEGQLVMPDMRSHTIWDTIRNTIEDPDLTLYLVLDEAHRGMKDGGRSSSDGKPTIVKQLINGTGGVPGIPVVWGISATVQRFNDAVAGMQDRSTLPNVIVDAKKVQDSGLLKDTINLDVPDDTGDFSTVLLRRGTMKLKEISAAWAEYAKLQDDPDTVMPLMVLQVPNSPNPQDITNWLDTIFEQWPELPEDSIANVFGEHRTETFGRHSVSYIAPERVQESSWIRILIAKDAISTGWDCPRAEVMVSFRAATDRTHITQLLGRMVRTPLARRIPGNDRLNAVDCLLPHFDKKSVLAVVTSLMTGSDQGDELPGRRVLINPIEVLPNPEIHEDVWQKLLSLPSMALPRRQARPIKRLTALAHELAVDGILADAGKKAHAELHKVLDGLQVRYDEEIQSAHHSVLTVEGKTLRTDIKTSGMTFNDFVENADFAVIEDAYRRAARVISPDLATSYSEHLASKNAGDNDEEALMSAHTAIAALGLVMPIKDELETAAEKLANQWQTEHRIAIKSLSDERQDVYRQIRELSADPLPGTLARSTSWLQPTTVRNSNGAEQPLPRFPKHMLCDKDGLFPDEFNVWETKILEAEIGRPGNVGWYRNPARASQDSLGITYQEGSDVKIVRPDFIFLAAVSSGAIVADIIDPHGVHLGDALPKLKGLAKYAEENGSSYRRIEAIAEIDGTFKLLDLTEPAARLAVEKAETAREAYESTAAIDYSI
ncbi:DEAD/DEAH box helicase [Rhizobium leguminosarum]|uniref:DEAD/DEAH box helicase n=1 Tax=Rhizobium leguminosarum TaxID=384 RepID=UPI00103BDE50|nr:DEAD/DEAH box helicase family protein [Rhizobium leguminosarum]TBZ05057.1 type III restriction endonuclease subunit R [Rhizobium leguminosarum bv. viciae]